MTIIAAVRVNDAVLMASDTLVTDSSWSIVGHLQKWIHGKKVSMSGAGSARTVSILQSNIEKFKPDFTPEQIWTTFVKLAAKGEWAPDRKEGNPSYLDCTLLFATHDRLLSFCGTGGHVLGGPYEILTRGSGGGYADGAWHALVHSSRAVDAPDLPLNIVTDRPREYLRRAVKAAMHYDRACGGKMQTWTRTRHGVSPVC